MSKEYYTGRVSSSEDRFYQVGKTVRGDPVSENILSLTVEDILSVLDVAEHDSLVDLGAGNGLLTEKVAQFCRTLDGVEASEELINVAIKYKNSEGIKNINYQKMSVFDLSRLETNATKAYCNEVVQHFSYPQLSEFFVQILSKTSIKKLYVCGVPDMEKKFEFYKSASDIKYYYDCLAKGVSPMGTWWEKGYIAYTADRLGYQLEFIEQIKDLHTSHYRFNFLVSSNE